MHPFLLAFVDSEFFKFAMWLLLIAAVVIALGWVIAFYLGTRFVFQNWRQARSAETRRQRFRGAAKFLSPFIVVGIWQLYKLVSTHYEAKQQAEGKAKSRHVVDSLRATSIGVYKLADLAQPTILATTSKRIQGQMAGHILADTAFVAEKSAAPFVKLILRADSTFQYRSNIIGDGTGASQQGIWKVECLSCRGTPSGFSTRINSYQPYFYTENHHPGNYESTSTLIAFYDKRRLRFMGSCYQRGLYRRFELKKIDSEAASGAP